MSQIKRNNVLEADVDLVSLVEQDRMTTPLSMLYQVLPTMLSYRIPTLPSLLQSLSDARRGRLHGKSNSLTEFPTPETPPPGYSFGPDTGDTTPIFNFGDTYFDLMDDAPERPGSSRSAAPPLFTTHDMDTGIKWNYASQGISLMTHAYRESSVRDADESSVDLTRQLYIHGITYLLRGLPAERTEAETLSLQAAMPPGLLELRSNSNAHALVPTSEHTSRPRRTPPQEPTVLHRITATIVFQTFILVQFLLPYIKLFLSHTYQFERKHQITKRLVSTSVTTVDELSRKSLQLSRTICQMNDGKVGQAIDEMTLSWLRSLTGGVQQGLEEGLNAIRLTSESSRRKETVEG
ncbi:hypothetical protein EJ02DRAFT_404790 [Clathrospora elynae]|uniref:Uncharacterized protein n=1 Tax=Clathrospora elynae TaxID=706981 RepID=A0A6A5SNU5_9PLEO|nr:hypothetical protein EJ02DRAFT_404790 [Clathrospora elynae]